MKKRLIAWLSLIVLLASIFSVQVAFAEDDVSGVYTNGEKWREEGCVPCQLNFGHVELAFGEDIYDANSKGKCNNFKDSVSVNQIQHLLDEGHMFYVFAKFTGGNIGYLYIDASLVITAPGNKYYLVTDTWTIENLKGSYNLSWFFDITKKLNEIKSDNGGSLPKGTYSFSMIFNGYTFRTASIKIK